MGKQQVSNAFLPKALKVEPKTTTTMLYSLFLHIRKMKMVPSEWKNAAQDRHWTLTIQLLDLDYADDICLLS